MANKLELQFIQISLAPDGNGEFDYEYAIKDHLGNTRVMFDQTGKVLQDQSYYPFGMSMGEELTYNMPDNLPDNKYLYNGKELQMDFDLGWYDYGARFYDPALGRWHVPDPLEEEYFSLSSYSYVSNNPLLFVDPNGMEIQYWQFISDGEGGGEWERVNFEKLDKTTQKALEAFAKTDEGFNFFKDFAKKGDKVGSVEFSEDGKHSKHDIELGEFASYGAAYGNANFREGNDNLIFELGINTDRNTSDENAESMAITIGHEAFIHLDQFKDDLISAYENDKKKYKSLKEERRKIGVGVGVKNHPEHKGYAKGDKKFSRMRRFVSQLKSILNPEMVDKKIKSHDKKFK